MNKIVSSMFVVIAMLFSSVVSAAGNQDDLAAAIKEFQAASARLSQAAERLSVALEKKAEDTPSSVTAERAAIEKQVVPPVAPTPVAKKEVEKQVVPPVAPTPVAKKAVKKPVIVASVNKVDAVEGARLMKANNCTACHAIDKKVVGPAFKDVAAKYRTVKTYQYGGNDYPLSSGLLEKVSKGGSGVWGRIPMPSNDPNGKKTEDIKKIIAYILSL